MDFSGCAKDKTYRYRNIFYLYPVLVLKGATVQKPESSVSAFAFNRASVRTCKISFSSRNVRVF